MGQPISQQEDYSLAEGPSYLMKLDIGTFQEERPGRTKIEDIHREKLPDNSVFDIYCSHVIAHVENLKRFMEELWRVLVPHGRLYIFAPYYTSVEAFEDHRHKNFFTEKTFLGFSKKKCGEVNINPEDFDCNFEILHIRYYYNPEYSILAEEAKEFHRRHYWNVLKQIEVDLKAVK